MATLQECRAALTELTKDIAESGTELDFDRSLTANITDLGVILKGRIENGGFTDIEEAADPAADLKLTLSSDDLVQMCSGELNAMKAMATGRLKIQASMGDLMKLRKLLK
ncbi:MAG: SCP2 sterol-binding domain-containing protein [Cumulibacter sp.]|uniref:SCP2 sterol-binding domain-containing protein n=1 Tax=Cumulibacter soli TaxID=2546344 RepID=UPI0010672D0C|nr:SCP2 sterol-binding domain-containing protein [Cumulibacter soli]